MKKRVAVNKSTQAFTVAVFAMACVYNFSWLSLFILKPTFFQAYYPFPLNEYPVIFTSLKTIVVLLAFSYLLAVFYPAKLWGLAALSLVAKTGGAAIAFALVQAGFIYTNFYWQIIFNDLIWLPAMGFITYQYFKAWQNTATKEKAIAFPAILKKYQTQYDISLEEIQNTTPVMLVFLRHFGCTFCKEALGDLAQQRTSLENEQGIKLVFVHMAYEPYAQKYFTAYGLEDVHRISDPACTLYQAFSLKRASFNQVFGIKSWLRGLTTLLTKGHGIGKLVGDGFRMPGVFIIHQNKIHQSFRHQAASDLPPYQELASCPLV